MAVRRATRKYTSIPEFIEEYNDTLVHGGILLPVGSARGELANQFKLDLQLPLVGRIGPITAQVVHRQADGRTGVRLPNFEDEAGKPIGQLLSTVEVLREYLMGSGDFIPREVFEELQQQIQKGVADLEAAEKRIQELETVIAEGGTGQGVPAAARRQGRGFAVPDLTGVDSTMSGPLSDRSLRDAIIQLAVKRSTGLLTVTNAEGMKRYGFWNKGGPVGWRTDPLQETEVLGVLLYKAKQLSKTQLEESLRLMEESNSRQGEALIDMGVLTFPQLIMVLGKQVEYILQRVMRESDGTWTFHNLETLPEQFLPPPLRVPSLLFRGLVKRARELRGSELANTHRVNLDRYVFIADDIGEVVAEVKLQKLESKLLEVLKSSSWRLRELFSVSPLSKQQTAAVLWAFNELGFLVYRESEDRDRYLKRVVSRIRRKKAQLIKATHFDVLEVHWISLPQEIEQNFNRLQEEFSSSSFRDLPPDVDEHRALIVTRFEEAFEVLRNPSSRRQYRKEHVEDFMIVQSAELLSRKGEMAIMRQDRKEACACFSKALELIPNRSEYADGLRRSTALV